MVSARMGTNASGMRRYNARLILAAVRRLGGASKAELARVTSLSPQATVRIVDELSADGMLYAAEKRTGAMGQPATVYRIDGSRGHTVGVEIGREGVTLVLLDFGGRRKAVRQALGSFPVIDTVVREIGCFLDDELDADLLTAGAFMGVGIAMPWFLGEWYEELGISAAQAREWRGDDVEKRLRDGIVWPTFFENDGNAAALAHLLCGQATDLHDFMLIQLGTFVGGGIVLGGRLLQGRHGNAGALASMPVCLGGAPEYLVHHASLYNVASDDAALAGWVGRCAEALGFAVIGANSLLDLEAIVLDGLLPVATIERVAAALTEAVARHAPPDFFMPPIRIGRMGDAAVATGAGLLPLHASFAPDLASLFKSAEQ